MAELWDAAETQLGSEEFKKLCSSVKHDYDNRNLETLLSKIDGHVQYGPDGEVRERLEESRKTLLTLIVSRCTLIGPSDKKDSPHAVFLDKITRRKVTLPRAKVFTLNYDTLFEQAAILIQSVVLDGFSFLSPREFSGRHYDLDIVQREKSRVKDEDNFIARLFHLYKLHGSLNWEKSSSKVRINESTTEPMIVFPRESKYENSYEQPFFEMMARFQQNLRLDSTTLICIGYSFSDKHINVAINEALDQNPGFQLVIVNPNFRSSESLARYVDAAHYSSQVMMIDEKFADFAKWFPENKTYQYAQGSERVLLNNEFEIQPI